MDPDCLRATWSHCNAFVFMLKTLLCIAQQSGPFKSCSIVLSDIVPHLFSNGLYPLSSTTAKAWESMKLFKNQTLRL